MHTLQWHLSIYIYNILSIFFGPEAASFSLLNNDSAAVDEACERKDDQEQGEAKEGDGENEDNADMSDADDSMDCGECGRIGGMAAPPATRQLSQTDHLNKKLLSSLLDRFSSVFPSMKPQQSGASAEADSEGSDDEAFALSNDYDEDNIHEEATLAAQPRGSGSAVTPPDTSLCTPPATATPVSTEDMPFPFAAPSVASPLWMSIAFRVVEGDSRLRPARYATSRLPQEIGELCTAEDVIAIARQLADAVGDMHENDRGE